MEISERILALSGENKVVILDEPFSGLETFGISTVSEVIMEKAEEGTNMIIVSHLWKPIYHVVNKIVILAGGKVAFVGKREEGLDYLQRIGI
ncbi:MULTISPECIES: transporter [Pyrococcus]|uniref:Uncharacterized protein n=1 Tax=Pyrococcus furiosus (strain ATCC 43587 / DSM 3638 / JCM 8422 / Vc1) TaxID=186497 RepID=Q8U157_PYRFU|nr:transporter [Pyrococcus furiosus]AAL81494.1 hypothetical protein PF1370 [Pyrococcus furiosus DSM 3638]